MTTKVLIALVSAWLAVVLQDKAPEAIPLIEILLSEYL